MFRTGTYGLRSEFRFLFLQKSTFRFQLFPEKIKKFFISVFLEIVPNSPELQFPHHSDVLSQLWCLLLVLLPTADSESTRFDVLLGARLAPSGYYYAKCDLAPRAGSGNSL